MQTKVSHLVSLALREVLDQELAVLLALCVSVSLSIGAEPVAFVAYRDELEIPVLEQRAMNAPGTRVYSDSQRDDLHAFGFPRAAYSFIHGSPRSPRLWRSIHFTNRSMKALSNLERKPLPLFSRWGNAGEILRAFFPK